MRKIARLFIIKNRLEACAVIYALAIGSIERGMHYLSVFPGFGGWLLLSVCPIAVVMAGARLMELTRKDNKLRRRKTDFYPAAERGAQPAG
jgi:hypothetical protein